MQLFGALFVIFDQLLAFRGLNSYSMLEMIAECIWRSGDGQAHCQMMAQDFQARWWPHPCHRPSLQWMTPHADNTWENWQGESSPWHRQKVFTQNCCKGYKDVDVNCSQSHQEAPSLVTQNSNKVYAKGLDRWPKKGVCGGLWREFAQTKRGWTPAWQADLWGWITCFHHGSWEQTFFKTVAPNLRPQTNQSTPRKAHLQIHVNCVFQCKRSDFGRVQWGQSEQGILCAHHETTVWKTSAKRDHSCGREESMDRQIKSSWFNMTMQVPTPQTSPWIFLPSTTRDCSDTPHTALIWPLVTFFISFVEVKAARN